MLYCMTQLQKWTVCVLCGGSWWQWYTPAERAFPSPPFKAPSWFHLPPLSSFRYASAHHDSFGAAAVQGIPLKGFKTHTIFGMTAIWAAVTSVPHSRQKHIKFSNGIIIRGLPIISGIILQKPNWSSGDQAQENSALAQLQINGLSGFPLLLAGHPGKHTFVQQLTTFKRRLMYDRSFLLPLCPCRQDCAILDMEQSSPLQPYDF